ncbi:MAG TPA: TolC family protein [Chitinophagaceae bacterium]|nr:TolC family protein [Chitinophagaceae bacterium]
MMHYTVKRLSYLPLYGICLLSALFLSQPGMAQLTIAQCYALARQQYPLTKQLSLIEKTRDFTVDNIARGWWPQFSVNGQASYQSAVTQVPIALPNIAIPVLSKDQYKLYADLYQPLTDGYTISKQKALAAGNASTQVAQLEVELYKLKERINQLFFGILLADLQIVQNKLLEQDIANGLDKVKAAIANGTALKSSASLLEAELLKARQRSIEIKAGRNAYASMLSVFINQPVTDTTSLQMPQPAVSTATINRPEMQWYQAQKASITIQQQLIKAKTTPRLGLFGQGGYGKPGLNMLSNEFAGYYVGGLRLNWSITGFYTAKKEKAILQVQQEGIQLQQENFLLNTRIQLAQQNHELQKYQELLSTDQQIIELRAAVKATAANQLQNGTITGIDYLSYVNAEDMARQNLLLHQVQWLMTQYNISTTTGN